MKQNRVNHKLRRARLRAKIARLVLSGVVRVAAGLVMIATAHAGEGYATWFSGESCVREGTSGITANGRPLDDSSMWCALPERPPVGPDGRRAWGRRVRITNPETGEFILAQQWDLGPGRRARQRGVVVDLTPTAFQALRGDLQDGRLKVIVEVL